MLPSRDLWLERPPVSLETYKPPDTHTQPIDGPHHGVGDIKNIQIFL